MTRALAVLVAVASLVLPSPQASAQDGGGDASGAAGRSATPGGPQGPVRLRSSSFLQPRIDIRNAPLQPDATSPRAPAAPQPAPAVPPPARPGEFELFVQRVSGIDSIRRFGSELMTSLDDADPAGAASLPVPPDYRVKPGDEIELAAWGSVDGEMLLPVDRAGRIAIPRVGTIQVAGLRFVDLEPLISQRFARVFKNAQVAVTLGKLRGLKVYVTGHVARPGAYRVSSLSTMTQVLMQAGGPAASGTFRAIQLRRAGQTLATLDLYDLLLDGQRGSDRVVEADDVIHVGPIGREVALIGSVNRPAIFELKPAETLADLLRMGGGFSAVADRRRLAIERLGERSDTRVAQLDMPASAQAGLDTGDVVRAFNVVDAVQPVERQNKRVRVEGEVQRPGDYVLPARSTIADAIRAAGGLTPAAYVFGTEFARESVRVTQQQNYDRALRDLETELARYNNSQRTTSADEAAAQSARAAATTRLMERLRAVKPTGRVVLQVAPDTQTLPDLLLEDSDRLHIPPRPTSVGVFGSVFNSGSYLHTDGRSIDDFLALAGGPTRGADAGSMFVIRANGSVVAARQDQRGWFGSRADTIAAQAAQPGDTVFVPEELDKTTFIQHAKDWGLIVSQFGLGIAAILAITR
jgi:protein involved in polysaccharide export with SLBB domain